jgi:hypothetical protein
MPEQAPAPIKDKSAVPMPEVKPAPPKPVAEPSSAYLPETFRLN